MLTPYTHTVHDSIVCQGTHMHTHGMLGAQVQVCTHAMSVYTHAHTYTYNMLWQACQFVHTHTHTHIHAIPTGWQHSPPLGCSCRSRRLCGPSGEPQRWHVCYERERGDCCRCGHSYQSQGNSHQARDTDGFLSKLRTSVDMSPESLWTFHRFVCTKWISWDMCRAWEWGYYISTCVD